MENFMNEDVVSEEMDVEETLVEETIVKETVVEETVTEEFVETAESVVEETVAEESVTEEETATEDEAVAEEEPAERENVHENEARKPRTVRVVGVRFRTAGKSYYYNPGDFPLHIGTHVIAETARGMEYGTIVSVPMEIERRKIRSQVRDLVRIATPEDDVAHAENHRMEREAYRTCYRKIRERGLEMKLIDAEYTFDHSKILFYFTADGRIDFRDLVKDLAGVFKTRIELRQIGVRDETRILGGYGSCGRPLCCHTYLNDFAPVSIKMAKEQNLSLNPTKISGMCGRLMCCLKNEAETYAELNKNLPRQGDEVEGPDGLQGEVEAVNVLRQKVRILVEVDDEKEIHEYNADEITMIRRRKRGEAKRRSKRIENGQEQEGDLKKQTRKPQRPVRTESAETARTTEGQNAEAPQENTERSEHRERSGRRNEHRSGQNGQNGQNRERSNRERSGQSGEQNDQNRENREGGEQREGGSGNRRSRHRRGRGHGGERREGGQNNGGQRRDNQNSNAPAGGEG